MTFLNCLNDALDEGSVDAARAARAQAEWTDRVRKYENQGHPRHVAQVLAADDVKAIFAKEAGDIRHRFQANLTSMRQMQRRVDKVDPKNLKNVQSASVELLDYQTRAIMRQFNQKLSGLLQEVNRAGVLGNLSDPALMKNIVRELHGEPSGSAAAKAVADSVREALEDMRLQFNEAGGIIGKMDNWGLPHTHDRFKMVKAGKDKWVSDIIDQGRLDWSKMTDSLTGLPFQRTPNDPPPSRRVQAEILNDVYDNVVYGKGSREASYGATQGKPVYKHHSESRFLHFKSADDWAEYNKSYGNSDPFGAIMGHVHGMARDIASMRAFGPNPGMGLDYQAQLVNKRARELGVSADSIAGDAQTAKRMLSLYSGPGLPQGRFQIFTSRFFANTRHLITSAFLDRAIVASISDLNSMRLAATAVGMNPKSVMRQYGETISNMIKEGTMTTQQLKRDRWIMDTVADPGAALERFMMEVPSGEMFERLSSGSMKLQGLSQHTDAARHAYQAGFWGRFADEMGKPLDQVTPEFRKIMEEHGILPQDWDDFRNSAGGVTYEPEPGVTFLSPLYWREATTLPADRADQVFVQMQSLIERWTEIAVPTNSLKAKSLFDPVAFGLPPGSIGYEVLKSGGMFKSFVAAFTINQYRMIMRQPTGMSRAAYAANMAAGATVLGALSLQLGEIIKGNDPMDMRPFENPDFWARATLKGGGFAVIGDIVSTGESTWGGGFGSYLAGPMAQTVDDVWDLSISNMTDAVGDLIRGEEIDTGFAKEATRAIKRYTPGAQTPLIGPAFDRLVADNLHRLLDPEAEDAIVKAATARENRDSNASWWMPGTNMPQRAPNLGAALGQE
jgi:hypothetical protein